MSAQIFLNGITIEQLAEALSHVITKPKEVVPTKEDEILTPKEVCSLLKIGKTTLWNHTNSGKLRRYGLGNRIYYLKSEVINALKPISLE